MKLILAFFICGIVYATASPTCSEMELEKCSISTDAGEDLETEEYLNAACRFVGCAANYKRRCGTTGLDPKKQAQFKLGERIYNTMCGTKNKAMRQKYFDNIRCITRATVEFSTSCPIVTEFDVHDPNYCPNVELHIACTNILVSTDCGRDAKEVYEAFAPDLEFYGC